jgi:hypothetical protein
MPADLFDFAVADPVLDVIRLEERPRWRRAYLSHCASIFPLDETPGSSRFFFFISVSVSSIYRLPPLLINKYKQNNPQPPSKANIRKSEQERQRGGRRRECVNR